MGIPFYFYIIAHQASSCTGNKDVPKSVLTNIPRGVTHSVAVCTAHIHAPHHTTLTPIIWLNMFGSISVMAGGEERGGEGEGGDGETQDRADSIHHLFLTPARCKANVR